MSRSAAKDAPTVPAFCYEITTEPIEENPADYGLTAEELNRIIEISQELHHKRPASLVKRLEGLIQEFPSVPKLWNHLAIAYESAGRRQDFERLVEETYRRFPDYLFGIINYGMLLLDQNRVDEIPAILRGSFVLHELQHGRMTYHISEIMTFYGFLACYFLKIGGIEKAARNLDAMEQFDPDHHMTKMVRSKLLLCLSERMLGNDD